MFRFTLYKPLASVVFLFSLFLGHSCLTLVCVCQMIAGCCPDRSVLCLSLFTRFVFNCGAFLPLLPLWSGFLVEIPLGSRKPVLSEAKDLFLRNQWNFHYIINPPSSPHFTTIGWHWHVRWLKFWMVCRRVFPPALHCDAHAVRTAKHRNAHVAVDRLQLFKKV